MSVEKEFLELRHADEAVFSFVLEGGQHVLITVDNKVFLDKTLPLDTGAVMVVKFKRVEKDCQMEM